MAKPKTAEIKINPNNPRTISEADFKRLKEKIKRNPDGLTANKIVHKDDIIVAGNQRFRAINELKLEHDPEWFKDVSGWTDEQIREYLVTSNISDGDWNWSLLANQYEATELEEWGLELPLFKEPEEVTEDEAPEVSSEPPVSVLGEIYQLGRHKLICGDSTDENVVNRLFGEQKIDLYLTDPPYNVDYTGKTKEALKIDNDSMDDGEFLAFLTDANRRADEHMKNGAWKHEPILYGWKSGGSHSWYTDRKQTTVLEFDRPTVNKEHPTMKPINILAYLIQNSTKAGDLVYDGFSGSGSGLIACEQTDRTFYGCELDPRYVDVIRKRYAKFTNDNILPDNWQELTPPIQ